MHDYVRGSRKKQGVNDDDIDGRVKVDSWNMNYSKRKKKLKRKKVKKEHNKKMDALQGIYGVDARTMAGLDRRQEVSPVKAGGGGQGAKGGKGDPSKYSETDGMRSTMNTFKNTIARG
jgi:hypothetical protein